MVDRIFSTMGDLKVGRYVIIDEHPCKIVSQSKSKPGKHGAAKINIDAISVFDGSKHTLMKPSDSDVEVPVIDRKKAQVVSMSGNTAQLMDLASFETFEVAIPEEMAGAVEVGKEIQYMEVMGRKLLLRIEGGS
jgi:translation initiation factor 5A